MSERDYKLILAIESSCDETACAVLKDGHQILSSEIASQVDEHARFGGVVPEVASRQHLMALFPLTQRAIDNAGITLDQLDAIAVTRAPGLVGALLVGVSGAKALAYALKIPLIGINHLEAHLMAARLQERKPKFPYLGLIVSGGHTALYNVKGPGNFDLISNTRDDAAGEAYDKVAKMMGLGYPGGIVIDQLAKKGDKDAIRFPRAMMRKDTLDFSFSGVKTSVRQYLDKHQPTEEDLPDICASFQEAVVEVLVKKSLLAARKFKLDRWVLAGGVAANSRLRRQAEVAGKNNALEVFLPEVQFCTDNAAMIAIAAHQRLVLGQKHSLDMNAAANESLF